jgi:hypothetical protein
MIIKSQDKPNQERKWLIELNESEMAILVTHSNQACATLEGLSRLQTTLGLTMLGVGTSPEEINATFRIIFPSLPPEFYDFAGICLSQELICRWIRLHKKELKICLRNFAIK